MTSKRINDYIKSYQHYERSINRTIQARRQDRFLIGHVTDRDRMLMSIYGKSGIPSGTIATRFIRIYGIPNYTNNDVVPIEKA